MQPFRISTGGEIDRSRPLGFVFDGRRYEGYAGDTVASALLANGVRLIGRSFKYHRPRGIFTAGVEEPNALVRIGRGASAEPNMRATEVPLVEGLAVESQNRWPSLRFDVGGATSLLAPLFPAGFYYKTFMWPEKMWTTYERAIRRVAGMGEAPRRQDPDGYEKVYAHCDVLVVGAGPAGLMAAVTAARTGARVILAESDGTLGGALRAERRSVGGYEPREWVSLIEGELAGHPEVRILKRATAFGYYDDNLVAIAQHEESRAVHAPRQRVIYVRAKEVVLATGAIERPIVFADNDRPGIMLASAARAYANRYAIQSGRRAVVFTTNDSAYHAALDLAAVGIDVAAVVDVRSDPPGWARPALQEAGIELLPGHAVVGADGGQHLTTVRVMALGRNGTSVHGDVRFINCDVLCCSGGWTPTVHLFSQSRGQLRFDESLGAVVPDRSWQAERSAGACRGTFGLGACLAEGVTSGADAAGTAGFQVKDVPDLPKVETIGEESLSSPLSVMPHQPGRRGKRFVDLQNDVTVGDVHLAAREGYEGVEHLKRYTTLGMGTDQGRTSSMNGLMVLAAKRGLTPGGLGTTTYRAPFSPVTMGAIANSEVGSHLAPVRRTPMHDWHIEAGAEMVTTGLWLRARAYPEPGEGIVGASHREARHVRRAVGLVDVSTLGKIDIQGRDSAEFLNRVYINGWSKLEIGKARYGVMLREDGLVFDDGTTTRLDTHHYLMTTTTANAGAIMQMLEFFLDVHWPRLDVHVTSVTDQWAAIALSGPRSRDVLASLPSDMDMGNEDFPFMGARFGTLAGMPANVYRISFSGELAYEIAVPADYGIAMWEALMEAGRAFGIIPYGLEAMGLLRLEKGHVVIGAEIDGRTSAGDLGFERMVSSKKPFIGHRSLTRPALVESGRKQLIGLLSRDGKSEIPAGAQLTAEADAAPPVPMLGHVTSTGYSPNLERPIALAMLANGRARIGDRVFARSPLTERCIEVEVQLPVFIDPEGSRLRA